MLFSKTQVGIAADDRGVGDIYSVLFIGAYNAQVATDMKVAYKMRADALHKEADVTLGQSIEAGKACDGLNKTIGWQQGADGYAVPVVIGGNLLNPITGVPALAAGAAYLDNEDKTKGPVQWLFDTDITRKQLAAAEKKKAALGEKHKVSNPEYDKELAALKEEYARKIEDLKKKYGG